MLELGETPTAVSVGVGLVLGLAVALVVRNQVRTYTVAMQRPLFSPDLSLLWPVDLWCYCSVAQ